MLMKKLSKIICLSLSMMLLIETAGMNVRAADVNNDTTQAVSDTAGSENEPVVDVPEDETEDKTDDIAKENETVVDDVEKDSTETPVVTEPAEAEEDTDPTADVDPEADASEETEEALDTMDIVTTNVEVISTEVGIKVVNPDAKEGEVCRLYTYETGNESVLNPVNSILTSDNSKAFMGGVALFEKETYSLEASKNYAVCFFENADAVTAGATIYDVKLISINGLKATKGQAAVSLEWENVVGKDENSDYSIKYVEKDTTEEKIVTSSTNTVKIEKLIGGRKYVFTVRAKLADKVFVEASVEETPDFIVPANISGFTAIPDVSKVKLSWERDAHCSGYILEKYEAGVWKRIFHNNNNINYYDDAVTEGATYQYRICSYRNAMTGNWSEIGYGGGPGYSEWVPISVYVPKYETVIPMQFNCVIKSKAPYFATASSKKKLGYLKKGTKYRVVDTNGARFLCQLKDGRKVWVAKKRIRFTKQYWTKKDYTSETKERFVNSRNIYSKTKYMLWTSFYTQRANVFTGYTGHWKLIRVCPVSTGDAKHNSSMGMKTLYKKSKGWFRKSYYVKPVYYFSGANAFHSRLHKYKGGYKDGGVGRPLTNGCIRMNDPDIQWIYKNCPLKTRVYNY